MNETAVSIHTVIIFTNNMHQLADFYKQGLNLSDPQPTGEDHLGWPLSNLYFGLDQVDGNLTPSQAITLWFAVDDLEAAFNRFVALGAAVRYPPTQKPWGATLASLHDLDGNLFGLTQHDD